jgi:3'-5' exoribonuclease
MDRTGEIEARVWENANKLHEEVKALDLLRVAGKVNSYQGRRQVVVEAAAKVADGSTPLDRFVPSTIYDVAKPLCRSQGALRHTGRQIHPPALP